MIAVYGLLVAPLVMTAIVINGISGDHDNELLRYDPLVRHAAVPPPVLLIAEEYEGPIGRLPTPRPTLPIPVTPVLTFNIPQPQRIQPERNWEEFVRKIIPVTSCESGGDYSTNTGNGYYGGWQFDLPTWYSVGGTGLPSNASAQEQDQRAFQLYLARGWTPWPVCGFTSH